MEKKSETSVDQEIITKENITFEEFTIYPLKEKGIIKFKINAEVNDIKAREYLDAKKPAIRDIITRLVMLFPIEEIKKIYQSEELHKSIRKELNLIIGDNIKVESSFLGGQVKKKFLVVKVNVYDFSAVTME
jgi:flagellar basal body-associated protein FliL